MFRDTELMKDEKELAGSMGFCRGHPIKTIIALLSHKAVALRPVVAYVANTDNLVFNGYGHPVIATDSWLIK